MTISEFYRKYDKKISRLITDALAEDRISYDVTTKTCLSRTQSAKVHTAKLLCKEDCLLAGVEIFKKVFRSVNRNSRFKIFYKDGKCVKKGQIVLEVTANYRDLLRAERTALNFIQRMSGAATLTSRFLKRLKYKHAKILHTRKTTPNFRLFELAAVKIGGGDFHRADLSTCVMIKDNHIVTAGSVRDTLRNLIRQVKSKKPYVIMEVKNILETDEMINYGGDIVDRVMLDNFNPEYIETTARRLKSRGFKTELTGGINFNNFDVLQNKYIDYYSIGSLTHTYKSIDFSLEF